MFITLFPFSANIDSYCQHNPGAVLPHPTNCAWFYNCSVNGITRQSVYPFDVKYVQVSQLSPSWMCQSVSEKGLYLLLCLNSVRTLLVAIICFVLRMEDKRIQGYHGFKFFLISLTLQQLLCLLGWGCHCYSLKPRETNKLMASNCSNGNLSLTGTVVV